MVLRKSKKSLLGSSRPSYFREPKSTKRSASVKRRQHIRIRKRHATTVLLGIGKRLGIFLLIVASGAGIFFGGQSLIYFWNHSERVRVQAVIFEDNLPEGVKGSLPLKQGQNILLLKSKALEKEALRKFPELKEIHVRRGLDGTVRVKGELRTPVAFLKNVSPSTALDFEGVLFPISDQNRPVDPIPFLKSVYVEDRSLLLQVLEAWREKAPAFYSLVRDLETDRMHRLFVELKDGVRVEWGDLFLSSTVKRAERILKIEENFTPKKVPATLRFITDERIVMDANWVKILKKDSEGR